MVEISIIMPNLNGKKYLSQSLDSFLSQNYKQKELIVIDGQSTDGSHEILKLYTNLHPSIIWIKTPDKGLSDAINIGIEAASGQIIGYLGNDDCICEGLFDHINGLEKYIDFDAIFFDSYTYYINERSCIFRKPPTNYITRETLLRYGTIAGLQNIYFRRRVFDDFSFNVQNKYSMDYELLFELAENKRLFLYSERVATINFFDENITHINADQDREATEVALRFIQDYKGPLWCEEFLSEDEKVKINRKKEITVKELTRGFVSRIIQFGMG